MKGIFQSRVFQTVVGLAVGGILMPALATFVVGVLILVFWPDAKGIALGVLALVMGVFIVAGSIVTMVLMRRAKLVTMRQLEFIGRVSHELRTPLGAVRLHVDTLRMGRYDPSDLDQIVYELDRDLTRLTQLLEQLLQFRQMPIEHYSEPLESLSLKSVAREVVDRQAPQDKERIRLFVEDEVPQVRVPPGLCFEALANLVQNALVHGGSGSVEVRLEGRDEGVLLSVRDQGPGMDPGTAKKVFLPFYRAARQGVAGLGLGLAFVRRFVRLSRGRVWLDTEPGQGTIVFLWLPGEKPDPTDDSVSTTGSRR